MPPVMGESSGKKVKMIVEHTPSVDTFTGGKNHFPDSLIRFDWNLFNHRLETVEVHFPPTRVAAMKSSF
jgi:hypothetical protein